MRLVLAVAALAAGLCFDVPASQAFGNDPWCAVVSVGAGEVMGLPLSLGRGVQAECDRRQPRLLQHEPGLARLVCAQDGYAPKASETARAAALTA